MNISHGSKTNVRKIDIHTQDKRGANLFIRKRKKKKGPNKVLNLLKLPSKLILKAEFKLYSLTNALIKIL